MHKNRFLLSLFLGLVILIPVFMGISNLFAGIVTILAVLVLMITIVQFLSNYENRSYKGKKIEFITFYRHNVLRTYLKPKTVWVVYDRIRMRFRPANFREFPIKVVLSGIFGLILLYVAYLMLITVVSTMFLITFRLVVFIALVVFGFYNFFVSSARLFSLQNKKSEKLSKTLNRSRSLRNFAFEKHNSVEITPNFLLTRGLVTSVELLSKKEMNKKKLEKTIFEVSKMVNKI
jgi:hypothetical protein